jgi:hypothetical protein
MPIRPRRSPAAVLAALVIVVAAAGCAAPTVPSAPPAVTTQPVTDPGPPTQPGPPTHEFGPRRRLFTATVPDRFTDVAAGSPQAARLPQFASALANGSGALAVDQHQGAAAGYTPVIGGVCSLVRSRTADELAAETRRAVLPAADPGYPVTYRVDRTAGFPKVTGSYRSVVAGRGVHVDQVAGLAAPGKACVITMSTTDVGHDAQEFAGVMRSFTVPPAR